MTINFCFIYTKKDGAAKQITNVKKVMKAVPTYIRVCFAAAWRSLFAYKYNYYASHKKFLHIKQYQANS